MKKKILVIEDDDVLRETLIEGLEKHGYRVFEATNGDDGIKISILYEPDLVVTNIEMPRMRGEEVIRALDKGLRRIKKVKIIAMSGFPELKEVAEKAGCDAFLKKPFNFKQLQEVLQEAVDKVSQRRPRSAINLLMINKTFYKRV